MSAFLRQSALTFEMLDISKGELIIRIASIWQAYKDIVSKILVETL
jgi:hypothetical protein